jgi:hypothetical protein
MKNYGAEIFVADLIGLGMVRELGTLYDRHPARGADRRGYLLQRSAHAREPGNRRFDDDGPRPRALPRHDARHRGGPDDALLSIFAVLVGMAARFTMLSYGIPIVTFVSEVDGRQVSGISWPGWIKSFVFRPRDRRHRMPSGLQTPRPRRRWAIRPRARVRGWC